MRAGTSAVGAHCCAVHYSRYVVLSLAHMDDTLFGRAERSLRVTLPPFADM